MSYRIIEARFQMLDEAIARLEKSKYTKFDASVNLRGAVRVNPQDVATWIKPMRPTTCPPSGGSTVTTTTTVVSESANQVAHDLFLARRRTTLQVHAPKEAPPLVMDAPPTFQEWGRGREVLRDPKEVKMHHVAEETWANIERCISLATTGTAIAASGSRKRLSRSVSSTRVSSSQAKLEGNNQMHMATRASRTTNAHPSSSLNVVDQANDNCEPCPMVKRPPSSDGGVRPSRGRLLSRSSGLKLQTARKNWFGRTDEPSQAPLRTKAAKAAKAKLEKPSTPEETPAAIEHGSSDPAYYYLEIRLEHSSSLKGWRFRVLVTDTTAPAQPMLVFNGMECDATNCILFGETSETLRPTIFDPMRYFAHVEKPLDMYGHSLHIQVISEWPVQKTIVDTFIHFVDANAAPPPDAEKLLEMLQVDKLKVIEDGTAKGDAPPSTHDNSDYIYQNHFDCNENTPSEMDAADAAIVLPEIPPDNAAPLSEIELKKRELQRMRESMKNDMLREQKRLSSLR
ncbi:Aste57867_18232 [Aphanomyces stellatus]|uniref:Aste57867_18232 protein n=1 Tax=Aphanomyces stellatus TaxID=120398 RepID=A0A485L9U1_9STRA|nr:hypothetical protein As57867_018170 [Aphanomyces stellatus]VFT94970.1 Aste57867_18232 [Aphanomyces stellatus]